MKPATNTSTPTAFHPVRVTVFVLMRSLYPAVMPPSTCRAALVESAAGLRFTLHSSSPVDRGAPSVLGGTWDMMYSASAVIVRLGFTPRLTGTTEPSTT